MDDDLDHGQPAPLSPARPFYWSLRRELWENRSIYIAPLSAAGVILFGFIISLGQLPHERRTLLGLDAAHQNADVLMPYHLAAAAIFLTSVVVGIFYSLGALYGERRDRSILFWKSLPVSDLVTVLAKASVPFVVLPVVAFAVIVATQLIMVVVSGAALAAHGLLSGAPATPPLFEMSLVLLYGLAACALWYAPIYAWMLLVSGWARRNPFLWAFLPPLAICLLERMAFGTSYFAHLLGYRFTGFMDAFASVPHLPSIGLDQLDLAGFLALPGLWTGLAFAGAALAGAIRQRRRREPI
jgi:ABC-2 type transport system permease protein